MKSNLSRRQAGIGGKAGTSPELSSGSDFIERLGKAAALFSAGALALSVFYDYSFLSALGLQFSEVPTVLNDHVRSAIVWLPALATGAGIYALVELLSRRMFGFDPKAEKARTYEDWVVYIACIVSVVYGLFFSDSKTWLYYAFFSAWALGTVWAASHPRFRSKFNVFGILAFLLVPMAAAVVGSIGYRLGESMLIANAPTWRVTLKTESELSVIEVYGLRRFTEVAVLVMPDRRVRVLPNAQIVDATTFTPPTPRRSLVCDWFALQCGDKPQLP